MNKQRIGCLGIALILVLLLSVLLNFLLLAGRGLSAAGQLAAEQGPKFEESVTLPAKAGSKDKIAVIALRGGISGAEPGSVGQSAVDDIKIQLRQAVEDDDVKAIVLHIDSAGGEVTASDTIY